MSVILAFAGRSEQDVKAAIAKLREVYSDPSVEWKAGTRVRKHKEDPNGDITPVGTKGTILGGLMVDGAEFYLVLFDNGTGIPSTCAKWKLKKIE